MLGETVDVLTRTETGHDGMGEPVYEMAQNTVEGVLVRPLSTLDIEARIRDTGSADVRPDGVELKYSLAFPKTYTGDLTHAKVVLVDRVRNGDRDAMTFDVVGSPDRTRPCPTPWNMIAEIGVQHG